MPSRNKPNQQEAEAVSEVHLPLHFRFLRVVVERRFPPFHKPRRENEKQGGKPRTVSEVVSGSRFGTNTTATPSGNAPNKSLTPFLSARELVAGLRDLHRA